MGVVVVVVIVVFVGVAVVVAVNYVTLCNNSTLMVTNLPRGWLRG